jgi:hypothetical protein
VLNQVVDCAKPSGGFVVKFKGYFFVLLAERYVI